MHNEKPATTTDWTVLKLIQWTTSYFKKHSVESARASAEILLADVLDIDRVGLYVQYDRPLIQSELNIFKTLMKRRAKREPIAYILGEKEFWSLNLGCTQQVMIPRPETECLVEWALERLPESSDGARRRVLDLGTGSGAIVLALASSRPSHRFMASDISTGALKLTAQNIARFRLAGNVALVCSDWMSAFKPQTSAFDLIISNPPYIPSAIIDGLQPEVARFEPRLALDGGDDGLRCIRRIIHSAHAHLAGGGELMLEIGFDQKSAVSRMIEASGLYRCHVFRKDYGGKDRVVWMKKD
jgi:release factor glutamine methyltransferase